LWDDAVRPALMDKKGWAAIGSTPFGKNWFYEFFLRSRTVVESVQTGPRDRDREWVTTINPSGDPAWTSFRFTTYDNPFVDPDEIDELRRTYPELKFRREVLAEFVDDAGQVFRNIVEAAKVAPGQKPVDGHTYVFGLDWGRVNDRTEIAVVDATTRQNVDIITLSQIGFDIQRAHVVGAFEKWRPAVIWAEENNVGYEQIQALQKEGLPIRGYYTSHTSKAPLIDALALAIERGDLEILNDDDLKRQLADYSATMLPSGGYKYSAPKGAHDDKVIALALAWYGAARTGSVRFLVLE